MKDMKVHEMVDILNGFLSHQFSAIRIQGASGDTYVIDSIRLTNDGQMLIVSDRLMSELGNGSRN